MLFRYELKRILVDGGYIDMATGEYHFYVSDHLGNNRAVVREDGEVIQQTHYYPFGMAFADSKGREEQAYKYNGKELDTKFQLNTYDYAARYMDPAIGRFTSVDPHAENYYSWSPYAYVGNNPMRLTDPTGMDWYIFGEDEKDESKYNRKITRDGDHRMVVKSIDKDGNLHFEFYDFADPVNDPVAIDAGEINRVEIFSEADVRGHY